MTSCLEHLTLFGLLLLSVNAALDTGDNVSSKKTIHNHNHHHNKCDPSCITTCLPSCKFECCKKDRIHAEMEKIEHDLDKQQLQQLNEIVQGVTKKSHHHTATSTARNNRSKTPKAVPQIKTTNPRDTTRDPQKQPQRPYANALIANGAKSTAPKAVYALQTQSTRAQGKNRQSQVIHNAAKTLQLKYPSTTDTSPNGQQLGVSPNSKNKASTAKAHQQVSNLSPSKTDKPITNYPSNAVKVHHQDVHNSISPSNTGKTITKQPSGSNNLNPHHQTKTSASVINTIQKLQDELGAYGQDDDEDNPDESHVVILSNGSDNNKRFSDNNSKWHPVIFDDEKHIKQYSKNNKTVLKKPFAQISTVPQHFAPSNSSNPYAVLNSRLQQTPLPNAVFATKSPNSNAVLNNNPTKPHAVSNSKQQQSLKPLKFKSDSLVKPQLVSKSDSLVKPQLVSKSDSLVKPQLVYKSDSLVKPQLVSKSDSLVKPQLVSKSDSQVKTKTAYDTEVDDDVKTIKELIEMSGNENGESGDSEDSGSGSASGSGSGGLSDENVGIPVAKTNTSSAVATPLTRSNGTNTHILRHAFDTLADEIRKFNSSAKDIQLAIPNEHFKNLTETSEDGKVIILAVPVKLTDKNMIEKQAEAIKEKLLGLSGLSDSSGAKSNDHAAAISTSTTGPSASNNAKAIDQATTNSTSTASNSTSEFNIPAEASVSSTESKLPPDFHIPIPEMSTYQGEKHLEEISKNPVSAVLDQLKSTTQKIHQEIAKESKGFDEVLNKLKKGRNSQKEAGDDKGGVNAILDKLKIGSSEEEEDDEDQDDSRKNEKQNKGFKEIMKKLNEEEAAEIEEIREEEEKRKNNADDENRTGTFDSNNEKKDDSDEQILWLPNKGIPEISKEVASGPTEERKQHSDYFASPPFQPSRVPNTFHNKVKDNHRVLLGGGGRKCDPSCKKNCTPKCKFECCRANKKSEARHNTAPTKKRGKQKKMMSKKVRSRKTFQKTHAKVQKSTSQIKGHKLTVNGHHQAMLNLPRLPMIKGKIKYGTKQGQKYLKDTQTKLASLISMLETSTKNIINDEEKGDGPDAGINHGTVHAASRRKHIAVGSGLATPMMVNSCDAKCKIECLPSCRFECCKHANEE